MIGIIKCLKANCNDLVSASLSVKYLISISKTKNFALVKKFFKKVDKEEIKVYLKDLEQYTEIINQVTEAQKIYY